MNRHLDRRLGAAEQRRSTRGGIAVQRPGESADEAAARVGRGPVIVVPACLSVEDWESDAAVQQEALLRRADALARTGVDPGGG